MLSDPPWIENNSRPCPCGSGKMFRDCCIQLVPTNFSESLVGSQDDAIAQERIARARLTTYLALVFGNTLPLFNSGRHSVAKMLASADIPAVVEGARAIAITLRSQGRPKDAIPLLDYLSASIPLPGLAEELLADKACWYEAVLVDHESARRCFEGIEPDRCMNAGVLQAYLDIVGCDSMAATLKLVERIIETTAQPSQLIQYLSLRSLLLCASERRSEALASIDLAIQYAREAPIDDTDPYECNMCARCYATKYRITSDSTCLMQAYGWYDKVSLDRLNDVGRAELFREVGTLRIDAGEYEQAIAVLRKSSQCAKSDVTQVLLADALVRRGDLVDAGTEFALVCADRVSSELRLEYLQVAAMLAVIRRDEPSARAVISQLESLELADRYYREVRDRVCIGLLHRINAGALLSDKQSVRKLLLLIKSLRTLNQIIIARPKIYGVGIDINKLVDKMLERASKHKEIGSKQ